MSAQYSIQKKKSEAQTEHTLQRAGSAGKELHLKFPLCEIPPPGAKCRDLLLTWTCQVAGATKLWRGANLVTALKC